MSRTGLNTSAFIQSLRSTAGDGSIEWINQPIQASILLDIADLLEEQENYYIKGPVDANNEPIRIGDRVECLEGERGTIRTIERVNGNGNPWNIRVDVDGWGATIVYDASHLRLLKPDTWERIILEALKEGHNRKKLLEKTAPDRGLEDFVARCKALADESV